MQNFKRILKKSCPWLGLFLAILGQNQAFAGTAHPLDPLNAAEVKETLAILKAEHLMGDAAHPVMFPYLMLKEPPKAEVLAYEAGALGGKPYTREAAVVLYDREKSLTSEVTVDLRAHKVSERRELKKVQPAVMPSEFDAVPPIVKADPRFAEAMKRRGITNLDDVAVDIWAYGSPDSEHSETARLLRAIAYMKGKGKNFYSRPIEGFTAIVNMDERKIERVIDSEVYPVPPIMSDFDEKSLGPPRAGLRPLVISQPKGVSYTMNGNEIQWQNWSFRFAMHPREGLVLYLVRYNDHGKWRPVLYRASLSDMMVPYGHPDADWSWRAAFDEGEYGIGRYSGSLERGTDVPNNAKLLDALFVDDFGKPYVTKDAVSIYERDGGLLWKHFDMYNGGNFSRRARELVIGFVTTISNYDYGLNWVFRQDGTIELETQLTGIMLTKGSYLEKLNGHDHSTQAMDSMKAMSKEAADSAAIDARFGHLVAPNVVAPHHQHFFNFRLDMDVDGGANSVAELNTGAIPSGKENEHSNAFEMTATQLRTEKEAQRDMNFGTQRKWMVYNPEKHNSLGYPTSYILLPGENASPYLQESSPLLTRGGFVKHAFWATAESDDEMHAAGEYPNQRATADGLPVWTEKNRSLDGKDVVVWYTFCVTHAPRPEEWPVMAVHKTGFQLIPAGFFNQNPGMDVAK
jgi:primary-amine oxidase